ncbi:hypothetical protein ACP4OV_011076 [Aristida adscensionis]
MRKQNSSVFSFCLVLLFIAAMVCLMTPALPKQVEVATTLFPQTHTNQMEEAATILFLQTHTIQMEEVAITLFPQTPTIPMEEVATIQFPLMVLAAPS